MPETLSSLTTILKRIFQDATTTACESAVTRAYRKALRVMPSLARKSTDITPVAGTRSYDLPAECCNVSGVLLVTAADAGTWLNYKPRELLTEGGTAFTVAANGTVTSYFIESDVSAGVTSQLKLVVDPAPAAPSGGYPIFRVYHSEAQSLVTASTLPEGIVSPDYWIYQSAMYLAQELRPARVAEFQALAEQELQQAVIAWRELPRQIEPASTQPRK